MRSYNIHLIRHGSTSVNAEGRFEGCKSNDELSDEGIRELLAYKQRYEYPSVDIVYVSPLARCLQTADILYPNTPVVAVPPIQEIDFGRFTGKGIDDLKELSEFNEWLADAYNVAPPDGESGAQLMQRVTMGFDWIVKDMMSAGVFESAIITHGNVITSLLAGVGIPKRQPQQWLVSCGRGYTCSLTAQLWHRDGLVEAMGYLPHGVQSAVGQG